MHGIELNEKETPNFTLSDPNNEIMSLYEKCYG
jgi:hypothetical protein